MFLYCVLPIFLFTQHSLFIAKALAKLGTDHNQRWIGVAYRTDGRKETLRKGRTGSSFALAFCRSSRIQALYSAASKTEGWKFPLSRNVNH